MVEYLKVGWARPQLEDLLASMHAGPRDIMRTKGTPAAELGLLDTGVTDDRILDAMVEHPVLVKRPIVVTPIGARLARSSDVVLKLIDRRPRSFTMKYGEIVRPR